MFATGPHQAFLKYTVSWTERPGRSLPELRRDADQDQDRGFGQPERGVAFLPHRWHARSVPAPLNAVAAEVPNPVPEIGFHA